MASAQVGDQRDVLIERITQYWQSVKPRIALGWLAVAFLLISATSSTATSAPSSRDSILVDGNRRIEADTVRSYFHPTPDGRFDDAARDEALKALVATGLFEKISIEREGEHLIVNVKKPQYWIASRSKVIAKSGMPTSPLLSNPGRAAPCNARRCKRMSTA